MALVSKSKVYTEAEVEYSLDGSTWKTGGQFKSVTGNKETTGAVDVTTAASLFKEYRAGKRDLGDFAFTSVLDFTEVNTVKTDVKGKNNVQVRLSLNDGSTIVYEGFVSEFDAIGNGDHETGSTTASWTIKLQEEPDYTEAA